MAQWEQRKQAGWKREVEAVTTRPEMGREQCAQVAVRWRMDVKREGLEEEEVC